MAKSLSMDLRARVVAAIGTGMSCRQAALRFGISAASAIRWTSRAKQLGTVAPEPRGGDRRSGAIEAHAPLILAMLAETPDLTLAEIKAKLADRGIAAGIGTLWRFFERHRITLKKSRRTPPSSSGPMS